MRPFFLFRFRAKADLSFAFWPGGIKNACFFASLMISSVITLRLKRRNALSIDSPGLIVTIAIRSPSLVFENLYHELERVYLTRPTCWRSSRHGEFSAKEHILALSISTNRIEPRELIVILAGSQELSLLPNPITTGTIT